MDSWKDDNCLICQQGSKRPGPARNCFSEDSDPRGDELKEIAVFHAMYIGCIFLEFSVSLCPT